MAVVRRSLAIAFLAAAVAASAQTFSLQPVAGGFIADDDGDGILDRALSGSAFLVGGATNSFFPNRAYQGAYEFDLLSVLGLGIEADEIGSVTLVFTRTGVQGSNLGAPNVPGYAAGYVGNGLFGFEDWSQGAVLGSYTVYNVNNAPPTNTVAIDVTSFVLARLAVDDPYAAFNFRSGPIPSGNTIDNAFRTPFLSFTVVPEPNAALLGVAGVVAFVVMRGRRR